MRSGGDVDANGHIAVTYPDNVKYPLVVYVAGTYLDETKGNLPQSSVTAVRSLIADATAAAAVSGIPVTAITGAAVAKLERAVGGNLATPSTPPTTKDANDAIDAAASSFLGTGHDHTNLTAPVFDSEGRPADNDTGILAALAHLAASKYPSGADLSAQVEILASDFGSLPAASSIADLITQAEMDSAVASAVAAVAPVSGVVVLPPTIPTTPIGVIAPIVQAKTLLTSLRTNASLMANTGKTGFIDQQASAVQADLNNTSGTFSGNSGRFQTAVVQGKTLLANGVLAGTITYPSGTASAPCMVVTTSVTVVCQWYFFDQTEWATHQLTLTSSGVTYNWSDAIIGHGPLSTFNYTTGGLTLPGSAAPPSAGITPQTGVATIQAGSALSLNGNILPTYPPNAALDHTVVATDVNLTNSGGNDTIALSGSISEVDGSGAHGKTISIMPGSNMVATTNGVIPVSAHLVIQAKTTRYQFDGTLDMSSFAQDAAPTPFTSWYPRTMSFTGSVTNLASAATGKFMTGTLALTVDLSTYNPLAPTTPTNFSKDKGTFSGSITNSTVTPAMAYKVGLTMDASKAYNQTDVTIKYTDPSNNIVDLTETNISGATPTSTGTATMDGITVTSTLTGGNVYSGSPAAVTAGTATQIGTVSGSIVYFIDGTTVSLQ